MVKEREHTEEVAEIIIPDDGHAQPQVPVVEARKLYHL